MPRFSVIVPVYNRAATVLPTLESVRAQTFTDFECIVVDDGSNDGEQLREVVESLDDARFRYVRRENGGGGAARNTGIDEAKGEFVAFLDSDDRWLPEKLERDADSHPANRVVYSPMFVERAGRIVGQRPGRGPRTREPMGDYLTCGEGFVPSSTIVLPAQLAKEVRYDHTIHFGQDADFAIRLASTRAEFHMLSDPQAVMSDDETGERLSRSNDWRAALEWLDRIRPALSDRGYLAFRGWHVARMAADNGSYSTALRFYFSALARGAFPPRLSVKAFTQIVFRASLYRRFRT
jgi:glycosyltransferase involved in cell wall biosynthesis